MLNNKYSYYDIKIKVNSLINNAVQNYSWWLNVKDLCKMFGACLCMRVASYEYP